MASPRSPLESLWSMQQHSMDHNGYATSPNGMGDTSFDSTQSRQRRGSSPGKRALNWFNRSRSSSPQIAQPPSPTSFVVKSVAKQPGGVSGQQGNEYQQLRSQPLATSLGVPPGGPGGGVGYGTAMSSNDGRPEGHSRGRSRSPNRPPSPGAITAGAFRSGRVSPGPQSWTQAHTMEEQSKGYNRRERPSPSPQRVAQQSSSPSGPRTSPFSQPQQQQHFVGGRSPQSSSPLAGSVLAPTLSEISVNANEHPSRFSMPVRLPQGSGPPAIIPLQGLPSPIDIPSSPAQAGVTPLGSVSPSGSPAFFHSHGDQQARGSPGSPSLASRWMKGLFGRSPRLEERADEMYNGSGSEAQWMKQGTSPTAPYLSKHHQNAWSDGRPLAGSPLQDEIEAEERKKNSMRMAARIEDHHRDCVIRSHGTEDRKAFAPKQIVSQSQEWDPPQGKSPPGRKPVPRYTVQELQGMSQQQREDVAGKVDPDDCLSRLEGRLTPAQQIIADTRSRQIVKEREQTMETQVQRGFKPGMQQQSQFNEEKPTTLPSKSRQGSTRKEEEEGETPVRRGSKRAAPPVKPVNAASSPPRRSTTAPVPRQPAATGLMAGNGPMPKEMPMGEALQEMMIRFYRFERYAVPLMRSLEARIVDVERDNQMALHGDGMSHNSTRDQEMDKWVGQMTGLMKHEIGQLKAATREIREGREILAQFVKVQSGTSSGFLGSKGQVNPVSASNGAGSKSTDSEERDTVKEMNVAEVVEHNRRNNFSSSTFNSAVPRKLALDIPGSTGQEVTRQGSNSNASPSGRTRYTSVLGQPMHGGKISPAVSPSKEKEPPMSMRSSPTSSDQSSSRRAQSLDERLKALVVGKMQSPSIRSASTHASQSSLQEEEEDDEEESDNTSFEKIPSHEMDEENYQVVMARGESKASARSASDGSRGSIKKGKVLESQYLRTPSRASRKADDTIKKTLHQSSSSGQDSDGGRNVLSFPTSPTPSRHRSTSPAAGLSSANITTSSLATNGLRARAQSYLLNADGSSNSSTPSSPNRSPLLPLDSPPLQVKPLRVHKSATTISTSRSPELLGSNAVTLKSNNNSASSNNTNNTNNNTPVRPSIRDRVAFFDAPK